MRCRISDLRRLEMIDILTGDRLGYADDFGVDTETRQLIAVIQHGRERLFGMLGREKDREIPFGCVKLIGSQTILVQSRHIASAGEEDPLAPYYEGIW